VTVPGGGAATSPGPGDGARAGQGKVKIGFFSFTEITDPGEHRSYNEWHMFDHMPEQYPLAGIVYGQRWVSTPACRAARSASGPELDPIHYVTLYLISEPVERTLREFMDLGAELHRRGRFHQHRRSLLSGPFRLIDQAAAERVLISAEAVPYRPNRGVHVSVARNAGPDPAELVTRDGVAGCWTFAATDEWPGNTWHADDLHVTVCWLDDDPIAAAGVLPAPADAVLAGPFETITPERWDWFES
jgi:hypothetical protein